MNWTFIMKFLDWSHGAFHPIPITFYWIGMSPFLCNKLSWMIYFYMPVYFFNINKVDFFDCSIVGFPNICINYTFWFHEFFDIRSNCISRPIFDRDSKNASFWCPFNTTNNPCSFNPVTSMIFPFSEFWFVYFDNDVLPSILWM